MDRDLTIQIEHHENLFIIFFVSYEIQKYIKIKIHPMFSNFIMYNLFCIKSLLQQQTYPFLQKKSNNKTYFLKDFKLFLQKTTLMKFQNFVKSSNHIKKTFMKFLLPRLYFYLVYVRSKAHFYFFIT